LGFARTLNAQQPRGLGLVAQPVQIGIEKLRQGFLSIRSGLQRENLIEHMTSDRKLEAYREGSK
jgi:hypothetical protein